VREKGQKRRKRSHSGNFLQFIGTGRDEGVKRERDKNDIDKTDSPLFCEKKEVSDK